MKNLNIGLIGYGFMGKMHSFAITAAPIFYEFDNVVSKKIICGRGFHSNRGISEYAKKYGWEEYCTEWRELIDRKDINIIDIASPPITHKEIVIAAAENGKHIFCEKPLALNSTDAKEMFEAVKKSKVKNMIGFNYRKLPAISLAKKLIDRGDIGMIYHFRAAYLQDWLFNSSFPLTWKLDKKYAGAGVHTDLNSHMIDLARYLIGEFNEVVGAEEIFIKERPLPFDLNIIDVKNSKKNITKPKQNSKHEFGKVKVPEINVFLARFDSGALGVFEASRLAGGRKSQQFIEIYGSEGSLLFEFEKMNELKFWSAKDNKEIQGFRKILVNEECHPYGKIFWPPGHLIGYENTFISEFGEFIKSIEEDTETSPNFYDGYKNNLVLDTVSKSIEMREWQKVPEDIKK